VRGKNALKRGAGLVLALVLLSASALANTGVEYDEEGGVWDWDHGTYTPPGGTPVSITENGVSESSGNNTTVENSDGSITIITGDQDIQVNEDGSITVESGQIQIIEPESESPGLTQEEWEARMQRAQEKNGTYTYTVYHAPDGIIHEVQVIYVGLGRSMVLLNGAETLVNTWDLSWETEAPADKVLAVVSAPKNGYANLRSKSSKKAFIMDHCITNKVVRVLATGKNWTKVDYAGMRGYVSTSSLTFYANEPRQYETAKISVKGRTKGTDTVYIRSAAKNNSRHLQDYVLGTPLTVFSKDGKWCEVDVEGWHCYILSNYVTYDEVMTASEDHPQEALLVSNP